MRMKLPVLVLMLSCACCYQLAGQDTSLVSVFFAGDIMQHESQLISARTDTVAPYSYDFDSWFMFVGEDISASDVAIGNLEVPLGGPPYSGYPRFCAPDELASSARDAGFDILLLANNHCLDRFKRGVVRTVRTLDSLKIPHTGVFADTVSRDASYPLLFEKNGMKFALLNYTYGTNGIAATAPNFINTIDTAQIKKDIDKAKASCPDIIIACMHWGVEYRFMPEESQRRCADFLLRHGVQVVIGSHPHVVQPMEMRYGPDGKANGVVVYSLGNYISGQKTIDTQGGAWVKVDFVRAKDGRAKIENCSYGLVWVWKPTGPDGRVKFRLIPVAKAERGFFPLSAPEKARMDAFARNARNVLEKNNIGIKEYKN